MSRRQRLHAREEPEEPDAREREAQGKKVEGGGVIEYRWVARIGRKAAARGRGQTADFG